MSIWESIRSFGTRLADAFTPTKNNGKKADPKKKRRVVVRRRGLPSNSEEKIEEKSSKRTPNVGKRKREDVSGDEEDDVEHRTKRVKIMTQPELEAPTAQPEQHVVTQPTTWPEWVEYISYPHNLSVAILDRTHLFNIGSTSGFEVSVEDAQKCRDMLEKGSIDQACGIFFMQGDKFVISSRFDPSEQRLFAIQCGNWIKGGDIKTMVKAAQEIPWIAVFLTQSLIIITRSSVGTNMFTSYVHCAKCVEHFRNYM
jgi:hypothetical protein